MSAELGTENLAHTHRPMVAGLDGPYLVGDAAVDGRATHAATRRAGPVAGWLPGYTTTGAGGKPGENS